MLLDKAINKAKFEDEEKVAISLKVPKILKEQLSNCSSENKISMNSLIVNLLDISLNFEEREARSLDYVEKLERLIEKEKELQNLLDKGVDIVTYSDGSGELNIYEEMDNTKYMIKKLKEF